MPVGTVKWFNTTKGYGFIAPEGGKKDVFVHISAVERSGLTGLKDNQKVSVEKRTMPGYVLVGVDVGGDSACLLRLRDDLEGKRRFA